MSSEWHCRSFFLELKPRTELASLFVDCPHNESEEENNKENETVNLIRVCEHSLEMGLPAAVAEGLSSVQCQRFCAHIADLSLKPDSVCAPTWADNNRLFMCKVHAEVDGVPLVPKTFHRLAQDMCGTQPLEKFAQISQGSSLRLRCNQCQLFFMDEKSGELSLGWLPSDDWLQTSPSGDYYCRDTCGSSCDANMVEGTAAHSEWIPQLGRPMLSQSYTVIHMEDSINSRIIVDGKLLFCSGCSSQIGVQVKNFPHLFMVHHSVSTLTVDGKDFISYRFNDPLMFFSQLILSSCEIQSSLKLVIRSYDRTPHILIWLLDSYVVLASGDLNLEENYLQSSTPLAMYKRLISFYKEGSLSFKFVKTFNMDEYVGMIIYFNKNNSRFIRYSNSAGSVLNKLHFDLQVYRGIILSHITRLCLVIILITGSHKALALHKAIECGVSHMWTVSAFQNHPLVIFIADEDATIELKVKTVKYFKGLMAYHRMLIQ
uniref:E3 ubiquitin-protein ligase E3D n=1 Tax=Heterorhabditis bacteriophora TaxID=37862 RepID=A0A1I7X8N1_HETBA